MSGGEDRNGEDGKDIRASGLDAVAQGITLTLAELKEIGVDSMAGAGRGFSELSLSGLQVGHEALTSAFESFCERWEWGVRELVIEGNRFAQNVGLAAGTLYETDQYVHGALKVGANSLIGNPYASEDEVTQMGWGELAQSSVDAYTNPDYSKESFEQAWENSKQGWNDAGRDVMTSRWAGPAYLNPQNLHEAFGVSDQQYDRWLDDTFGPSPEARAEAAEQQASTQAQAQAQAQQDGNAG
ncbi:hypothetical protein ACFW2D_00630 [Streptomyces sp. NPDC058914]|uniref:hypothetical protein n=1 Tax=Streptomyces sp. NPDC058914 TaxID=3346671 RepID=UPI0036D03D40